MNFKDAVLTGGGGGGGGSFKNRPDNLRSTDSFEALLGLVSVPATLAPGGLRNLFVNDVAIEDHNGESMLEDFTASLFEGDPTQLTDVKLLLGSSAGSTSINLSLSNNGSGPGPWVNGTVLTQGVDFIDLRFVVNSLYQQDKKGIYNATANLEIQLRPSGTSEWVNPFVTNKPPIYSPEGTWIVRNLKTYFQRKKLNLGGTNWRDTGIYLTITGKTTSAYVKEIRIAVPNTDQYAHRTWEVRVRLLEREEYTGGENGADQEQRKISWESISGVKAEPIGGTEPWRGLSYLHVHGKASDQLNGIPEIKGVYRLGKYLVPPPSVFNAETRVYTGATWDGVTTQYAWTQCPAWQLKWLIEDDLSGVSALAPGSTMNKWDTLEASKWFAQPVSDGKGGMHPRYSANWIVENSMKVTEIVAHLAGAVGALAWDDGDGRWRMKVEKPENPQMIFTKENIIGEFAYSHTDWDSRFNDITATYRDRENNYKENRVRVFDQPSIDQSGRRHTSIVLVGCDNRQEALRRAKLRLITSLNETRTVTFTTNRQGGLLEPLSVIAVADGDLNASSSIRSTGRIVFTDASRKHIRVRDSLRLEVGVSYQIALTVPNPDYSPDRSSQPDTVNWRSPTLTVMRTLTNTPAQRGDVVDLYLDQALPVNTPEFAPVALSAFGLPALPKQYRVLSVIPSDDGESVAISGVEIYTAKWLESDGITEDDILGQISGKTVPPPLAPVGGMFHMRSFASEFGTHRNLYVSWMRPSMSLLDGYKLQIQHNDGGWVDAGFQKETIHELQNPAHGDYQFRVIAVDRKGRESEPLIGKYTVIEVAGATPTPLAELTPSQLLIPTDSLGQNGDYTKALGQFAIYEGANKVPTSAITFSVVDTVAWVTIDTEGRYVVTDPGIDNAVATLRAVWNGRTFDKPLSVVKARAGVDADNPDILPPPTPTGLTLATSIEANGDGRSWIKLTANWNLSIDPNVASYVVGIRQGVGEWVEFNTTNLTSQFYWNVEPNTLYGVRIRAVNGFGATSDYSEVTSITTTQDVLPPEVPTSLTATAAFQTIFLSWNNPLDADISHIEVWESPNTTAANAVRIGTVAVPAGGSGSYSRTGLASGVTRYYRLVSVDSRGNRSGNTGWVSATTAKVNVTELIGEITREQIGADAIGPDELAAGAVGAGNLAANAVTADKINANAVTAGKISANAVTADKINANAVTAGKIAANAVTTDKLEANSVTAVKIAAQAVSADKIDVANLSAISAIIGLLRTSAAGARVEIESNQIRVYDANNVMRVRMGIW